MAEDRLNVWQQLFTRALSILDAGHAAGLPATGWTFGGGTVLMRRHRHRVSRDVDIFIPDPQWLGYLTPRLNAAAESLTGNYVEQAGFLKLYFPEGEIDFIVSAALTSHPAVGEEVLGRAVMVETSSEIIAKKIWHRSAEFAARDVFDFALVMQKEPQAEDRVKPFLSARREVLARRLAEREIELREDFAALDVIEFDPSYDECVGTIQLLAERAGRPSP